MDGGGTSSTGCIGRRRHLIAGSADSKGLMCHGSAVPVRLEMAGRGWIHMSRPMPESPRLSLSRPGPITAMFRLVPRPSSDERGRGRPWRLNERDREPVAV